jgi:hypothetical protein
MTLPDSIISPSTRYAWISRRTAFRAVLVLLLLAGGIALVRGLQAAMNATFDKPPAPLRIPLSEMPANLGSSIRYSTFDTDQVIDADGLETLGTNDYLLRHYIEKTANSGEPHSLVTLNLNYYPTGSSTPHVPEICWAANGLEEAANSRREFEVPGVNHADGTPLNPPLRMRMISFIPPKGMPSQSEAGEPLYINVAYVFHVNGEYVATPQEVMSHFWSASNKFAYHCKIEVTPLSPDSIPDKVQLFASTQAQAQEIVSRFIREAIPAVENCLPDPVILKQGLPAESADAGK